MAPQKGQLTMSDNVQFSIRLPRELYRALRSCSNEKNLSLNQLIVSLLAEAAVENLIVSAKILNQLQ